MSKASKQFRHTINKKKYNNRESYGVFRYGRIMSMKYAKGYCNHHNCLLCAHDFKCKHCNECKHFTPELVNAY